jgi:hypothetical protein
MLACAPPEQAEAYMCAVNSWTERQLLQYRTWGRGMMCSVTTQGWVLATADLGD